MWRNVVGGVIGVLETKEAIFLTNFKRISGRQNNSAQLCGEPGAIYLQLLPQKVKIFLVAVELL
jgi:hypothetical protein